MKKSKIAKNILLGQTCRRCVYYMLELNDLEFCEYGITDKNKLYKSTIPIPKERTCENWRTELDYKAYIKESINNIIKENNIDTTSTEGIKKLLDIAGYKGDSNV